MTLLLATSAADGGVTALMIACDKAKPLAAAALLRFGADPRRPMLHTGNLPAHFAAGSGSVECLELLSDATAQRDLVDHEQQQQQQQQQQTLSPSTCAPAGFGCAVASGVGGGGDVSSSSSSSGGGKMAAVPGFSVGFSGGGDDMLAALQSAGGRLSFLPLGPLYVSPTFCIFLFGEAWP